MGRNGGTNASGHGRYEHVANGKLIHRLDFKIDVQRFNIN